MSAFARWCQQEGVDPDAWLEYLNSPVVCRKCFLDCTDEDLEAHWREVQARAAFTQVDRALAVLMNYKDGEVERAAIKTYIVRKRPIAFERGFGREVADGIFSEEFGFMLKKLGFDVNNLIVHYLLRKIDATDGFEMLREVPLDEWDWLWLVGELISLQLILDRYADYDVFLDVYKAQIEQEVLEKETGLAGTHQMPTEINEKTASKVMEETPSSAEDARTNYSGKQCYEEPEDSIERMLSSSDPLLVEKAHAALEAVKAWRITGVQEIENAAPIVEEGMSQIPKDRSWQKKAEEAKTAHERFGYARSANILAERDAVLQEIATEASSSSGSSTRQRLLAEHAAEIARLMKELEEKHKAELEAKHEAEWAKHAAQVELAKNAAELELAKKALEAKHAAELELAKNATEVQAKYAASLEMAKEAIVAKQAKELELAMKAAEEQAKQAAEQLELAKKAAEEQAKKAAEEAKKAAEEQAKKAAEEAKLAAELQAKQELELAKKAAEEAKKAAEEQAKKAAEEAKKAAAAEEQAKKAAEEIATLKAKLAESEAQKKV